MIEIKVLGPTPPCAKCKRAEREALKAAERFGGRVAVSKVDALSSEAEAFGMIVTPAVVVDGQVVGSGRVVPADELAAYIAESMGE
jgi:hypothetical protein